MPHADPIDAALAPPHARLKLRAGVTRSASDDGHYILRLGQRRARAPRAVDLAWDALCEGTTEAALVAHFAQVAEARKTKAPDVAAFVRALESAGFLESSDAHPERSFELRFALTARAGASGDLRDAASFAVVTSLFGVLIAVACAHVTGRHAATTAATPSVVGIAIVGYALVGASLHELGHVATAWFARIEVKAIGVEFERFRAPRPYVRTAAGGTGPQRALVALGGPLADAALAVTLASSSHGRETFVARVAALLALVAMSVALRGSSPLLRGDGRMLVEALVADSSSTARSRRIVRMAGIAHAALVVGLIVVWWRS